MKKELSEKQLEAKRLYSQIMEIDLTEVPVSYIDKYGEHQTHKCIMCNVNGIKYIQPSKLDRMNECANFFTLLEKKGCIFDNDYLYCRRGGNYQYRGGVNKLIRVSTLLRYKDELLRYLMWKDSYYGDEGLQRLFKLLEDDAIELPEITIDKAIFYQSKNLYLERLILLQEDKADRREKEGRELLEEMKNEQQHREPQQESETLKDLVSKIEAMGWDVTLSLKPV